MTAMACAAGDLGARGANLAHRLVGISGQLEHACNWNTPEQSFFKRYDIDAWRSLIDM
jgi:hypothetical protein